MDDDDDDNDDDYIESVDDDVDEDLEVEQIIDPSELGDSGQQTEENDRITTSSIDLQPLVLPSAGVGADEYISDDEELTDAFLVLSVSVNNENKQILELLHQTRALLIRSRKLIRITRNIGVIDHYVRHCQDGPQSGFVLDMEVSLTSSSVRVQEHFYE